MKQSKECCVCGNSVKIEAEKDIPLCKRKSCLKAFIKTFSSFCKSVDEQAEMETEGFLLNGVLIRYNHFDEDFEKAWKQKKRKEKCVT